MIEHAPDAGPARGLPRSVRAVVAVYRRNALVWRKLAVASLMANLAEPLITLVAFGYGLGRLLPEIDGHPYITYLAAGSVCMSTAMSASFESLYSAFSRMQIQGTWEAILNGPVAIEEIVVAEWLWSASKASFSGLCIIVVVAALGICREATLVGLVPLVILCGLCYSAIALAFNALARGYDFFTYYFTLFMTPSMFLSGVYFPRSQLPHWLQPLAAWLPLSQAGAIAQPLLRGDWPPHIGVAVLVLAAFTIAGLCGAIALTRRRFRR